MTIALRQSRLKSSPVPAAETPVRLPVRRFSLEEYHRLIEIGFFADDERVELIEGILVPMSPMHSKQAAAIRRLDREFGRQLSDLALVSVQMPISLPRTTTEPEPDLALARLREDDYSQAHPDPEDLYLVVEVAYSSLANDEGTKAELYARSGIQEYWIFNLIDELLVVYRNPFTSAGGVGSYQTKITLHRDDIASPLAFPDCKIRVREILP